MERENDVNRIIQELISFGYYLEIDSSASTECFTYLERYDWLNRQSPQFWYSIAEGLVVPDLEALIKALAMAETQFCWRGGSVSAVIWTFKVYQEKENINSERLADWLLARTPNSYVPFGTQNFGARSIDEYRKCRDAWNERKCLRHQEIMLEQEEARKRKEGKRRRGLEREKEQRANNIVRREYLTWFTSLSQVEQLKVIARDDTHTVDYFPVECAITADGILRQLDTEDRMALINRLIDRRKGPWRSVCIKLMELE